MSSINVNTIKSRLGGPPTLPSGVVVSAAATFSGNVSVGGTLTYEDVTNIDVVGLITARNGIKIGAAGIGGTIAANGNTTLAGIVTSSGLTIDSDSNKILLGADKEMQVFHNGTDSLIKDTRNSGTVKIQADNFTVIDKDASETMFSATVDASVELYEDGTKRLETTTTGVSVAGTTISNGGDFITYDNGHFKAGLNADLDLFHNGTDSYIRSAVGDLNINAGNSAQNICINLNENVAGVTSEKAARFIKNGAAELYYDNSKKIETYGSGTLTTGITSTTSLTVGPGLLQESFREHAFAPNGTYNHDISTYGTVLYNTTNSTATFVLNIRADGSTTLNSIMNIGQTTVFTWYTANNSASYYLTDFQIDGASQTEKWNGGSAPTAGTGSGVDVYTFNIMKTADATYTVFANFSNFA